MLRRLLFAYQIRLRLDCWWGGTLRHQLQLQCSRSALSRGRDLLRLPPLFVQEDYQPFRASAVLVPFLWLKDVDAMPEGNLGGLEWSPFEQSSRLMLSKRAEHAAPRATRTAAVCRASLTSAQPRFTMCTDRLPLTKRIFRAHVARPVNVLETGDIRSTWSNADKLRVQFAQTSAPRVARVRKCQLGVSGDSYSGTQTVRVHGKS